MQCDVVIASYGRAKLLERCLESIFTASSSVDLKLYVLTQSQDIETIEKIKNFSNKLDISIIEVEEVLSPGASRNRLVEAGSSEYIFFLDDDAYLSRNYFQEAQRLLSQEYDILGGPDLASDDSQFQKIIGHVLASQWVMGPTSRRHSSEKEELKSNATEVDLTLCNLWLKRKVWEESGVKFDENLLRCEENLFLEQLLEKKATAYFSSLIPVYHLRRVSLIKLANIQFKSGYSRGLVMTMVKKQKKIFFYIPLVVGIAIALIPYLPMTISRTLVLSHAFMSILVSLEIVLKTKLLKAFFWSWMYIITIHTFFSVGILFGYIKGKINNAG